MPRQSHERGRHKALPSPGRSRTSGLPPGEAHDPTRPAYRGHDREGLWRAHRDRHVFVLSWFISYRSDFGHQVARGAQHLGDLDGGDAGIGLAAAMRLGAIPQTAVTGHAAIDDALFRRCSFGWERHPAAELPTAEDR